MADPSDPTSDQLALAKAGDVEAMTALFHEHRARLKRIVDIRLDPRVATRVDASDVLQDTFLDMCNRVEEFTRGDLPFFLWVRLKLGHRLTDLHRFHLRHRRTVAREVSIHRAAMPAASTASLASQLLGRATTASKAVMKTEQAAQLQRVLNSMGETDREVLVLRHFEDLSNAETAQVLEISQNAASNRYVRALKRLKLAMDVIQP